MENKKATRVYDGYTACPVLLGDARLVGLWWFGNRYTQPKFQELISKITMFERRYIISKPSFFGIHVNSWECNFLCDTPCCWGNDWTSNFSCWLIIQVSPFVQEGVQKFSMELSDFFWWWVFQGLFLIFAGRKLRGT